VTLWQTSSSYETGITIDQHLPYKINNKQRLLTDTQEPLPCHKAVNADL